MLVLLYLNQMKFNNIVHDFKNIKSRNYRKVWEPFMKKYRCDVVCELGVYKGDNFMEMISHEPKLAVAVDSWKNDGVHSSRDASYSQEELKKQYAYFKSRVRDLSFVQIIQRKTVQAAKRFSDEYFDFVYIDADHSVEGCYSDITSWYPKVKPGKFLVGHDYHRRFGVVDAVNKFIKDNKLELILLPPSTWAVIKK